MLNHDWGTTCSQFRALDSWVAKAVAAASGERGEAKTRAFSALRCICPTSQSSTMARVADIAMLE